MIVCRNALKPLSRWLLTLGKPLALSATVLFTLATAAQAQEWTLDREQLVEEPKPYSPFVDQYFP